MAEVHQPADRLAPPDEWLALSDAERAALQSRAGDLDPQRLAGNQWREVDATIELEPVAHEERPESAAAPPTFDDALRAAESLDDDDRLQLMTQLWVTLPREQRSAVLRFQFNDFIDSPDPQMVDPPRFWPGVWRTFFDAANTSQLYSAPQRFDLATIFIVTLAYSLLLGGLTVLDGYWATFGAGTASGLKIVVGSIITLVAASQALLRGIVNPRGVSIVVGIVAYSIFSIILWSMYPRAFPVSFTAVAINGLLFGAALGYISGVLVGGVFLAADALRGKLERNDAADTEEPTAVVD